MGESTMPVAIFWDPKLYDVLWDAMIELRRAFGPDADRMAIMREIDDLMDRLESAPSSCAGLRCTRQGWIEDEEVEQ